MHYITVFQVTVSILDINDHNPVFLQTGPVSVSVLEQSTPGTLVTVLSAVDVIDFGDNTHVVYAILSGNGDCERMRKRERERESTCLISPPLNETTSLLRPLYQVPIATWPFILTSLK